MNQEKSKRVVHALVAMATLGTMVAIYAPDLAGRDVPFSELPAASRDRPVEPIIGLEHVALNVSDPLGVVEWFTANLDMRVVRTVGDETQTHFLADAAGSSMLEVYHNTDAPAPDYMAMHPLTLHLAFTVSDVVVARERLLAAGATPEGEVVTTASGDMLAMMRSPQGLPIQLARRAVPMLPRPARAR